MVEDVRGDRNAGLSRLVGWQARCLIGSQPRIVLLRRRVAHEP